MSPIHQKAVAMFVRAAQSDPSAWDDLRELLAYQPTLAASGPAETATILEHDETLTGLIQTFAAKLSIDWKTILTLIIEALLAALTCEDDMDGT